MTTDPLEGAKPELPVPLQCRDCGTTQDVEEGFDPYAAEIHHEHVPYTYCMDCYSRRAEEI